MVVRRGGPLRARLQRQGDHRRPATEGPAEDEARDARQAQDPAPEAGHRNRADQREGARRDAPLQRAGRGRVRLAGRPGDRQPFRRVRAAAIGQQR